MDDTFGSPDRFEVIDHREGAAGRIIVMRNVRIQTSLQDDGRTLKVFITDKKEE